MPSMPLFNHPAPFALSFVPHPVAAPTPHQSPWAPEEDPPRCCGDPQCLVLTTESWTPSFLMIWEQIRAINTFVNYRTLKQPKAGLLIPSRQSWDKPWRSGFILFYLNELIYESLWNSAQHRSSVIEVFALLILVLSYL